MSVKNYPYNCASQQKSQHIDENLGPQQTLLLTEISIVTCVVRCLKLEN